MELLDSQALVLTKHHYRQLPRASLGRSSLPPAYLPLRTGAGIIPGSPMVTCKAKQRSGPSVGKGSARPTPDLVPAESALLRYPTSGLKAGKTSGSPSPLPSVSNSHVAESFD